MSHERRRGIRGGGSARGRGAPSSRWYTVCVILHDMNTMRRAAGITAVTRNVVRLIFTHPLAPPWDPHYILQDTGGVTACEEFASARYNAD